MLTGNEEIVVTAPAWRQDIVAEIDVIEEVARLHGYDSLSDQLRPFRVGKDTELPDYVVLISTLGGISIFGLNGFVIGPVIAAMFIAVWDIFSEQATEDDAAAKR